MAVDENFKRKGVGTKIVKELENYALSKGMVSMILNARENAISFYLSLGYQEVGPYQSDTGIPHKTMKKRLIS
jgi:GNAT superfamily N-acetyltransferase